MINDVQKGVYDMLSADAMLTAILGSRIYPVEAPQKVRSPYIIMRELDINEIPSKDGPIPQGWVFQVDVYAKTYDEVRSIKTTVRKALNWATFTLSEGGNIRTRITDNSDAPFRNPLGLYQYIIDAAARLT